MQLLSLIWDGFTKTIINLDLQKAVNWFQKAADKDYYNAKNRVQYFNEQGHYAKEDEQEGILI
jgi:TPR repeat protein